MSATNLTKNLKLPQFVASDKPSWLGDVNGAMLNIDNGYGTLTGDIANANDTASSAKSQSDANTQTLVNVNSELESQGNRITALEAGGGTEQLEQRVNTLSTDVEALQTRTNTFEEKIAENGTNITNLTDRVTAVEGKVKTNTDNITSLQAQTNGFSESIKTLTTGQEDINARLSVTSATATNAMTNTQTNSQRINTLSNRLDSISISCGSATIEGVESSTAQPSTPYIITDTNIIITPFIAKPYSPTTTFKKIADINITANINTNIIGSGFYTESQYTYQGQSGFSPARFYITYSSGKISVYFALSSGSANSSGWSVIAIPPIILN